MTLYGNGMDEINKYLQVNGGEDYATGLPGHKEPISQLCCHVK